MKRHMGRRFVRGPFPAGRNKKGRRGLPRPVSMGINAAISLLKNEA
jgi:hypothetical protein